MTVYHYEASDSDGRPAAGEIEATDRDSAAAELSARGLVVHTLEPHGESVRPTPEGVAVAREIQQLMSAGLPLAEGLRAAADELGDSASESILSPRTWWQTLVNRREARIRQSLRQIAGEIESGRPLEEILERNQIPGELGAVMRSGIPSHSTAMAIGEYSAYATSSLQLRSEVWFLFAYPIVAMCLTVLASGLFFLYLVPSIRKAFDDYELELPVLTQLVMGVSDLFVDAGPWFSIVLPIALCALLVGFLRFGGESGRRIASAIPLFGASFRNVSLARMSHIMAAVLRHDGTVNSALRAAGTASRDRRVNRACCELAETIESGEELPIAHPALSGFPLGFVQMAEGGSNRQTVADALHSIGRVFEQRARAIMRMFAAVVQPLVIVSACGMIGLCFLSLLMPVIRMLGGLAFVSFFAIFSWM